MLDSDTLKLSEKLGMLHWPLVLMLSLVAGIGIVILYSAAGGSMTPWASRHLIRFAVSLGVMIVLATIHIKYWYRLSYLFYFGCFFLLLIVEFSGVIGMGAQRWLDLGVIRLQPSELMKLAVVMVLARYFHGLDSDDIRKPRFWLWPAFLILLPVALVLKQPDLGTAGMIVLIGAGMLFLAGVPAWLFILGIVSGIAAIPIGWNFLHDYQQKRVLTFLNPESDPLGAGYHITQSKIALGSGGVWGKGYLQGSQSHLNFLPEKQTDFIFTMFAEEFGLVGGVGLLLLFLMVIFASYIMAMRAQANFSRLLILGVATNFALYVFINVGMVMGLLPVVGVPLPLISYGGTVMLTTMVAFGMALSADIHRDIRLSKSGAVL